MRAPRALTHPLVIVAGTVLTVFAVTLLIYWWRGDRPGATGAGSAGACGEGKPDPTYDVGYVAKPDPPSVEGTLFELTVRQGDRVVTGAKVCLYADMPDMSHSGFDRTAFEISSGQYEVDLQFGMGGRWRLALTVAEPGKPAASIRFFVEVAN